MSQSSKNKAPVAPSSAPVLPAGEMPETAGSRTLKSESHRAGLDDRWMVPGVCIFLAAIIWVVFGQTLGHDFIDYDDKPYVFDNPAVAQGLTLNGIVWAFTHVHCGYWIPLTWISHMLDCQCYGLNPGGHHFTNVLLHAATAILLFLALRQMTAAPWRSAFVAAVFAIHPLRVESVAWVAERKDVLSGLFFMLTLWAYARYAQGRSRVESRGSSAGSSSLALDARCWTLDYYLVLLFFACGLMSKPMLVTLPFVLLLLDYWPLNRLRTDAGPGFRPSVRPVFKRLVFEKLPLFGLAAASGVTTLFTQTGAIAPFERISIPFRVGNASISYVTYMGQMFWPSGLAVFYPFPPGGNGVARVVLSMVLLAGISAGVFVLRRRPYLLTGWLWYLIMLVPVIGIVQSGAQARADRFTYFPQIGLYLLLTWAVTDLVAGWRHRRVVLIGLSTVILVALIVCARAQTAYWRNSVSLWIHTLACTSDNAEVHSNLGIALFQKGDVDAAMVHFRKALQINPDDPEAHDNFGTALFETGRLDEAIAHFRKALQINPDNAIAQNNLGNALLRKGSVGEAITHFQKALQIMPDSASAHYNLGNILLQTGNGDEAMFHYQKALQIKPGYAEAHYNLGNILVQKGRVGEAITQFQTALQIKPDYAKALNNLAWLLATCSQASLRNGNQAVELAQRANQFAGGGNPVFLGTLATAYAEAGRFPEAVETAQRALQLAEAQSNPALADAIRSKLKLYQAGSPFHYAEHTP